MKKKIGESELVPTNFAYGLCGKPACQSQFGPIGGVWTATDDDGSPTFCGMFGVKPQCIQTKWPIKNKEKCCAGTIDNRTMCDPTWCPLSKGCGDTDVMINHCSVKWGDKSRILTDPNCTNWCRDFPKECDIAKINYCREHPEAPECKCIAPQHQKSFRRTMKQAASIGLPTPTAPSYCWYEGCAGEDLVDILKTTNIINGEKACPANNSTICAQIVQFQKGSSNNVVDGNDFKMTCGRELPKPKPVHDPRDVVTDGIDNIEDRMGGTLKMWYRLSKYEKIGFTTVGSIGVIALLLLLIRISN